MERSCKTFLRQFVLAGYVACITIFVLAVFRVRNGKVAGNGLWQRYTCQMPVFAEQGLAFQGLWERDSAGGRFFPSKPVHFHNLRQTKRAAFKALHNTRY